MNVFMFLCLIAHFLALHESSCAEPEFVSKKEFDDFRMEILNLANEFKDFMNLVTSHTNLVPVGESEDKDETFDPVLMIEKLNETIEERVTLLEFQVATLNEEVTDMGDEIDVIDGEIAVILADQVIQDERILETENDLEGVEESIGALQLADETLESALNAVNATVVETVGDVAELGIQLQDLDARVSELEVNGTIAFHSYIGQYTSIPVNTVIIFPEVDINIGNGYNSATGQFTVPSGGDGLYFFRYQGLAVPEEYAGVGIRRNGEYSCYQFSEGRSGYYNTLSCGTVVQLNEGDVVDAYLNEAADDTSFYSHVRPYNTFSGFRIAPE